MFNTKERAIRRLERQVERAQARLEQRQRRKSPIGFLSGLGLGTVAGALLTFFFTREEEGLPTDTTPGGDDTIVLRERAVTPTTPEATPRPLMAGSSAPDEGVADQLAAAELESPEAVTDIEREAASTDAATPDRPAVGGGKSSPAMPVPPPTVAGANPATPQAPARPVTAQRPAIESPAASAAGGSPAQGGRVDPVAGECPASHPIKGNKSSMGALIFHTAGSASYERTKPESCFATEADAEAAGYRAPRG